MNNEYNILTNIGITGAIIGYCLCSAYLMYYIPRAAINVTETTPVENLDEVQNLLEKGTLYKENIPVDSLDEVQNLLEKGTLYNENTGSNYTRKCIINDDYIKSF